jgi:hypothetical protein
MYKLRALLVAPFGDVYTPAPVAHEPTLDHLPLLYSTSCVAPLPETPERYTS